MSQREEIQRAIQKCVGWLASTQDKQGSWTGAIRSHDCIWYAAGLAIDGETPDSGVIRDICAYLEGCVCADGGVGPYPGEPSSGVHTAMAIPLLRWAGRDAAMIRRASEYLQVNGEDYHDPITEFLRWVFEPEERTRIGSGRGPSRVVQTLLLFASRKHLSTRWKLDQKYPRAYVPAPRRQKKLGAFLIRGLTYPQAHALDEGLRLSPQPIGFETTLFTTAAVRKLAGDKSREAERLVEFALGRRARFAQDACPHDWLNQHVADLFLTKSLGMTDEYQRLAAGLRRIRYEGKGWMRGVPISMNIFDTGLTLQALHAAGVPTQERMIEKACEFLLKARRPADGIWSWAYDGSLAGHLGQPDTDDTGAACVALAQAAEPIGLEALKDGVRNMLALQEADGSFSTFGGVLRPNWCYVSNTSRALQAMLMAGMARSDDRVRRAVSWLRSQQLADGSWVDGWCARYIYGTAMALEALMLAGMTGDDPGILRARDWLTSWQNEDGGWGESWYGARSESTVEHTGLALRALGLMHNVPQKATEAGARWLVKAQRADGSWNSSYFVEYGFGSGFADSQLPVVWALHGLAAAMRSLEPSVPVITSIAVS